MSKAADIGEPASELENLMADLSGLGQLVFVFGDDSMSPRQPIGIR